MTAADILERLGVPHDGVLYVQSSTDWLKRLGLAPLDVLDALVAHMARGTLVMPSYPSRAPHREYLDTHPVYDSRRTPVGVGLLPELFRRAPGVSRSLDPDYPVCALGLEAASIVGNLPGEDAFGPGSPYQRMLDLGATLVGLGVSLNTNSFIHTIDAELAGLYPFRVYEADAGSATSLAPTGETLTVRRRVLRPALQQRIKPSAIADVIDDPAALTAFVEGGVQCFRWDVARLHDWAIRHARTRLAAGRPPCWLEQFVDSDAG